MLEHGAHPSYFLYLTVPANSIDINIHPTKTEIKFDNEKALYAILRATIKHSLGQYNVAPLLDFNRDASLDTPYQFKEKTAGVATPKITVDPDYNPFKTEQITDFSSSNTQQNFKKETANWEALYTLENPFNEEKERQLFTTDEESQTGKTFQIQKKYLLSAIKSGMVLIHQSLAHQRVLYEDFLKNSTEREADSQQLLFPVKITFTASEIEMIYTIKEDLESTGFQFEEFTKEGITINGIPTSITESQITTIFEQLLNDIHLEVPETSFSHFDVMAKSFAKTLAVKTGAFLSEIAQENLVNNLFSCKEPTVSPFGKPTFKTLTLQEIDHIFNSL